MSIEESIKAAINMSEQYYSPGMKNDIAAIAAITSQTALSQLELILSRDTNKTHPSFTEEARVECELIAAIEEKYDQEKAKEIADHLQKFNSLPLFNYHNKHKLISCVDHLVALPSLTKNTLQTVQRLTDFPDLLNTYFLIAQHIDNALTQEAYEEDILKVNSHIQHGYSLMLDERKLKQAVDKVYTAKRISHFTPAFKFAAYQYLKHIPVDTEDYDLQLSAFLLVDQLASVLEFINNNPGTAQTHPFILHSALKNDYVAHGIDENLSTAHKQIRAISTYKKQKLKKYLLEKTANPNKHYELGLLEKAGKKKEKVAASITKFLGESEMWGLLPRTPKNKHWFEMFKDRFGAPYQTNAEMLNQLQLYNITQGGVISKSFNLTREEYTPEDDNPSAEYFRELFNEINTTFLQLLEVSKSEKGRSISEHLHTDDITFDLYAKTTLFSRDSNLFYQHLADYIYAKMSGGGDSKDMYCNLKTLLSNCESRLFLDEALTKPIKFIDRYITVASAVTRYYDEAEMSPAAYLSIQHCLLDANIEKIGFPLLANINYLTDNQILILSQLDIPNYDISTKIGEGVSSVVYKASDQRVKQLQGQVAIKVMSFDALRNATQDIRENTSERSLIYRFLHELTMLENIHHEHIVTLKDKGTLSIIDEQGNTIETPYIIQKYYENQTIQEGIRYFDTQTSLTIFKDILAATKHLHNEEWVHRDLKPANIYLSYQNVPAIGDLQSCLPSEDAPTDESFNAALADCADHTDLAKHRTIKLIRNHRIVSSINERVNAITGMPADNGSSIEQEHGISYAAPQQLETHDIDKRNDVYSLTLTFWEMLTKQKHRLNYGKAYQNRTLDINPEEHNATASAMATAIPEDEIYDHESMKQFFIQNLAYEKERRAEDANELLLQFTHTLTNRPRKKEFTKLYEQARGDPEMEEFAKEMELLYVQKNRNGGET